MSITSCNLLVQEPLMVGEPGNWAQWESCFQGQVLHACRSHSGIQLVGTVAVLTSVLALGLSVACLAWGEAGGEQHQSHLCSDEEPLYALQGTPEGGRPGGLIWHSV